MTPSAEPTPSPTPYFDFSDWKPVDSGPRDGAMGTTTTDSDGVPVTYTVVEGDSADLIRLRFDIWWDSLACDDGMIMPKYPTIYPDEVLRFVPPGRADDELPSAQSK